jgi:hypothetical protein
MYLTIISQRVLIDTTTIIPINQLRQIQRIQIVGQGRLK